MLGKVVRVGCAGEQGENGNGGACTSQCQHDPVERLGIVESPEAMLVGVGGKGHEGRDGGSYDGKCHGGDNGCIHNDLGSPHSTLSSHTMSSTPCSRSGLHGTDQCECEEENNICTAIDTNLGTTHSCVGMFKNGLVKIMANAQCNHTTPPLWRSWIPVNCHF